MYLEDLQLMLDEAPDPLPHFPTFLELSGYPHYENVCSNILKFYFDPNASHDFKSLFLKSFLQISNHSDIEIPPSKDIKIRREVTTSSGRIDILIISPFWVIAIENKIFHFLNNDLNEYSDFLVKTYKGRKIIKIVLSLKPEIDNLTGGFENVIYKDFLSSIETGLLGFVTNKDSEYKIYFNQFAQTIKNLYKPIRMERTEIEFLVRNQDKIANLIVLEQKLRSYINQRASIIFNSFHNLDTSVSKSVYEGFDVVFIYGGKEPQYKLECLILRDGITIQICAEPENRVNIEKLKKLDFFKVNQIENYRILDDYSRLVLEENIDFFIKDNDLIERLYAILALFKVTE